MLKIYNTLSGKKEIFKPIEEGKVGMYVCGNTVYDFCHIGHARAMISFDVISRFIRHLGYELNYVRNITDVDDKIIKRAEENNESTQSLTERMIAAQREDELRLGNKMPDREPKATEFMQEIIDMVQVLIDKGFAYQGTSGDVYYRATKFKDYGKLNNRKLEDMLAGARIDVEVAKEHPADFVLWKQAKAGEVSWSSPWGEGRPGWHIECSAMSTNCLGSHFDIHGGGPDLKFPHHENEIAQSEAATGKEYVNYWMHCGAVRVNNEKMSKSLGNFFTVRDVLAKFNPEVVRYLMVSSQYRSAIDYSDQSLLEAKVALERLYTALRQQQVAESFEPTVFTERFEEAMKDDFNTAVAVSVLFELVRELNKAKTEDANKASLLAAELRSLAELLGLLYQDPEYFLQNSTVSEGLGEVAIQALIDERTQARKDKNFARSDEIRDELASQGIELLDSREGTTWTRS
ncbi:cysteine--tRNA ligase [Marinomonas sp. UCMA 3892]|jgi:cysteinyl-tRNA synthetase|uniref:Cysteine--tRNA ligase n=1 Tax=Marinomonas sp. (strain MWYL1) TaxID=400668 RepID=SYC_MARMS|nr:cysteine--tRNA ligase [Marinomonas sp. UCMA 3892]A6VX53.1 RecName: Full=Cysteine--tRNA ligase; AltName: Full=Cysteinyl-tRNA synthetase; Short=CysRS [Marinomonas sp. MWYL1]NLU99417.1 cysteine--tRNA ligase [Marinomonas sp. UCMA 3892]